MLFSFFKSCPQMSLICRVLEQVTATWRPEEACRPDLEDAPVFYPTEEVFDAGLNIIICIPIFVTITFKIWSSSKRIKIS